MISAVILSGGHSCRMGQDKAGLILEGQTFLKRIFTQLNGIEDIYLSVGEIDSYADCPAVHIRDDYQECGPMGGIQKALSVCKHEYLFTAACDMPFIDSWFAFYLTQFLEEGADAIVPVGQNGRRYILGAIYHKRVKEVIETQLEKGDRKLTNILEKIKVVYVHLQTSELEHKLMNINRPKDYEKLFTPRVPIISFVGYSNTGKTTLIEKIISILKKQGIRTAYIKHTHHEINFPSGRKDSERMNEAGAAVSAVLSPKNALIVENREVDIHKILSKIDDVDLIVIEGYKQKEFPKIMVAENGHYPIPVEQCLAVVSDMNIEDANFWFSRNDAEGLSRFIMKAVNLGEENK